MKSSSAVITLVFTFIIIAVLSSKAKRVIAEVGNRQFDIQG